MRSTALLLLAAVVEAKHGAYHASEALHRRHHHHERDATGNQTLEERGGSCAFPTNAGLVAVTPGAMNGGWAFAPDQTCYPGRYCPYACPAGQVSMQWDPSVTGYAYPGSRNGGLLCNSDGSVSKPYPNRPYCQSTATNVGVVNNAGQTVSFCQTVLPGDEDMLIPTVVSSWSALAMPDPSYWAGTAAHYYINPPGVGAEGCLWGTSANPVGNWSPYVAGGNSDATGETFIKLGWNPVYLEQATPFRNKMPNWGVKIECPNGGCNGLPCAIDPSKNSVNEMIGSASNGAGGGAFCVVTVAKGATANFVVFSQSGSGAVAQSSSSSSVSVSSSTTSSSSSSTMTSSQSVSTSTSRNSTASYTAVTNTTTTGRPSPAAYYLVSNATSAVAANVATASASAVTAASHDGSHSGSSALEIPSVLALLLLAFLL